MNVAQVTTTTSSSRIRIVIASVALAISALTLGAAVPAVSHHLFEPTSITHVAPVSAHLLPTVTTHDGASVTPTVTVL
jgi:hypothetical protein